MKNLFGKEIREKDLISVPSVNKVFSINEVEYKIKKGEIVTVSAIKEIEKNWKKAIRAFIEIESDRTDKVIHMLSSLENYVEHQSFKLISHIEERNNVIQETSNQEKLNALLKEMSEAGEEISINIPAK